MSTKKKTTTTTSEVMPVQEQTQPDPVCQRLDKIIELLEGTLTVGKKPIQFPDSFLK